MSGVTLLESVAAWFKYLVPIKPILVSEIHLILSAVLPIYAGAHASLSRPSSAAKPPKKSEDESDEDEAREIKQKLESLEPSDAILFPLMAGITLAGLYLVIEWLRDPTIFNKALNIYFSIMGLFFATSFVRDGLMVMRSCIFPSKYSSRGRLWKANQAQRTFIALEDAESSSKSTVPFRSSPLPGIFGAIPLPKQILNFLWACRRAAYQKIVFRAFVRGALDVKSRLSLVDLVGATVAIVSVTYFVFVEKSWWLTNLLGFSFSYGSLQFMSPSTFATGSLILGALFLYDIYFVFFTPMMVTVATKLDVPIKLLVPRPPGPKEEPDKLALSMLGLGDIVIPGMMIGLALRYDLYCYYRRKGIEKAKITNAKEGFIKPVYQKATGSWGERLWTRRKPSHDIVLHPPYPDAQSFPKPFFYAGLVGYIIGMVATLTVMSYWNHPQPALLYLVPGVLGSLWLTAVIRGELALFWSFVDTNPDDDHDDKNSKNDGDKAKAADSESSGRSFFARLLSGEADIFPNIFGASDRNNSESQKEVESHSPELVEQRSESAVGEKDRASTSSPATGNETKESRKSSSGKRKDKELIKLSISLP
ncbi:hypothetical protein VTN49DRAFT_2433 [Thermomyces lanuginosus]|uniref:uncharacterized protein n=1 Tax=Thermomyces lanuginosus TaxID=5541 RepID=UPI0037432E29